MKAIVEGLEAETDELEKHGYCVLAEIGRGATSVVLCVREISSGRDYACKICGNQSLLKHPLLQQPGPQRKLFKQEAALLRETAHPLFPRWRDDWEADGQGFLIMEYVKGSSLEYFLKRRKRCVREAVRIGLELADGLGYLHEKVPAVLYRDLKACHVVIQADGRIKLLDLGAACLREESNRSRAGTPGYAAPEQLKEGGRAELASDVYALGKLLHFMLTGKNPCCPPLKAGPLRLYDPHIPAGLAEIVERCLAPAPQERIPDMRRLISQLAPYADGAFRPRRFVLPGLHRVPGERYILKYEKNIRKAAGSYFSFSD